MLIIQIYIHIQIDLFDNIYMTRIVIYTGFLTLFLEFNCEGAFRKRVLKCAFCK